MVDRAPHQVVAWTPITMVVQHFLMLYVDCILVTSKGQLNGIITIDRIGHWLGKKDSKKGAPGKSELRAVPAASGSTNCPSCGCWTGSQENMRGGRICPRCCTTSGDSGAPYAGGVDEHTVDVDEHSVDVDGHTTVNVGVSMGSPLHTLHKHELDQVLPVIAETATLPLPGAGCSTVDPHTDDHGCINNGSGDGGGCSLVNTDAENFHHSNTDADSFRHSDTVRFKNNVRRSFIKDVIQRVPVRRKSSLGQFPQSELSLDSVV
jgi:hypothetical protein